MKIKVQGGEREIIHEKRRGRSYGKGGNEKEQSRMNADSHD